MQDRSDRGDRGGSRDADERHDHGDRGDRGGPGGNGGRPDTRFLQLELSQVMYSEAEAVFRPAFRELLLEAAKERLRERFGDKITRLAQLAVDEELRGVEASLEIEARLQEHQEGRRDSREPLRGVLAPRSRGAEPAPQPAAKRGGGRRGKRGR